MGEGGKGGSRGRGEGVAEGIWREKSIERESQRRERGRNVGTRSDEKQQSTRFQGEEKLPPSIEALEHSLSSAFQIEENLPRPRWRAARLSLVSLPLSSTLSFLLRSHLSLTEPSSRRIHSLLFPRISLPDALPILSLSHPNLQPHVISLSSLPSSLLPSLP